MLKQTVQLDEADGYYTEVTIGGSADVIIEMVAYRPDGSVRHDDGVFHHVSPEQARAVGTALMRAADKVDAPEQPSTSQSQRWS